jgi:hypothetical protein
MLRHLPKRPILDLLKVLSQIDLISHDRQLMMIAEVDYLVHVFQWEYCAHWVGGVDDEEELGEGGQQAGKVGQVDAEVLFFH